MHEIKFATIPEQTVNERRMREIVGLLVDTVTNARYMRSLGTDIGRSIAITVESQLRAQANVLALVIDNAVDVDTICTVVGNAYDEGETTRSYQISRVSQYLSEQIVSNAPAKREEFTFQRCPSASACATDLRNRGFKVSGDLTGRTIVVETPAGWTGTPAADVALAHEPFVLQS